jgi:LPS O-antigen subunit length determinant protein (WzzB/FepE family)
MIRAFFWWVIWLVILFGALFLLMAALYDLFAVPLLSSEAWATIICGTVGLFFLIVNLIRLRRRRRRKQQRIQAEILEEFIEQRTPQRWTR